LFVRIKNESVGKIYSAKMSELALATYK